MNTSHLIDGIGQTIIYFVEKFRNFFKLFFLVWLINAIDTLTNEVEFATYKLWRCIIVLSN